MLDLLKESHKRLNDRVGQSMVLLWYNQDSNNEPSNAIIGTGFLIYLKNQKFIFSCHHVINEFVNSPHREIKFQFDTKKKFDLNNIIDWKTDEKNDVGYIELYKECEISNLIMMSEGDFSNEQIDWENNAFFVYGYPAHLGEFTNNFSKQSFQPFSFLTQHSKGLSHFIFDYPSNKTSEIEGASDVPEPYGISGAPVIMFEITPNRITDYTKAKIIGIEHSWNERKKLFFASPISKLFNIMNNNR